MASGGFISDDGRRSLMLLLPPFIYAILMMAIPLVAVVAISFIGTEGGFSLEHYAEATGNEINRALLMRSVMVSVLVTAVTVLLAYPVAYYISFHVPPARKSLWMFLITIPFWTSYLIRIFLWKVILGFTGPVSWVAMTLGLSDEPLGFLLYNLGSVVLTLSHAYAPFAILPIFVALEKIDRSLLEASQDLGENRITTFWRVTLPLSVTGIVAAVLIVFIPTIGDYVTPELVGGSGNLLIANRIQALFLQVDKPGLGAALSLVTMATVGVISLIFVFLNRRWLRGR